MSETRILNVILFVLVLKGVSINGDCILGRTDLVKTSPNPTPGLFIDTGNPALCSGQITAWNLCYYNPRPYIPRELNSLQISLQVWRFDELIQNGVRVGERVETVAIPETPASFQCITVELSPEDYMDVSAGDFIGVVLNRDAVLPVVGNTPLRTSLLFYIPSLLPITEVVTPNYSALLSSNVLHVTAEIAGDYGATIPPTNAISRRMTRRPMQATTRPIRRQPPGEESPRTGGANTAVIASVVVIIVLFIFTWILLAIVVLILKMSRREKTSDVQIQPHVLSSHDPEYSVITGSYNRVRDSPPVTTETDFSMIQCAAYHSISLSVNSGSLQAPASPASTSVVNQSIRDRLEESQQTDSDEYYEVVPMSPS